MAMPLALQYLAIGVAVAASAWFVMKKQFPAATRRLRIACALPLLREGRAGWVRTIGRRIAPPAATAAAGCGGCSSCEPKP